MIPVNLLFDFGAVARQYKKGSFIINEGAAARFYFQLVSGEVKMCNTGDDGQEFIQGLFREGDSFGEPPLFLDKSYPASAIAITDCEIMVLEKSKLLLLLLENFDMQVKLLQTLSKRLYFKTMMSKEITLHDAGHRIITLIDFMKKQDGIKDAPYAVTLTRQQVADLTGLRVETVIRTMKHLVEKKQLQQKGRKIYR
ncbi:MAG: Crp/Fnr family transcriptional regulator [Ferruginibacter sp.]